MYCIKCGTKLTETDNFCTNCGTKKEESNISNPQNIKNKNQPDNLSLILSILSIIMFWFPLISIPFAIVGIIIEKKQDKKTGATIISIISLVLSIVLIFFIIVVALISINYVKETIETNIPTIDNYENYNEEEYDDNNKDKLEISGYKWRGTDSSILYLEKDQNYNWYLDETDYSNNFHRGTYSAYTGYEAVKYIAENLSEYNITEEQQLELFKTGSYDINNYLLIILKCNYSNINGNENTDISGEIPYYGFYYQETKKMSLINMKSLNSAEFTLIEENKNSEEKNNHNIV